VRLKGGILLPNLTFVIGIPGSGATVVGQTSAKENGALLEHIPEKNDSKSFSALLRNVENTLRKGQDVWLLGSVRTEKQRRPFLSVAEKLHVKARAILVDVPIDQALLRLKDKESVTLEFVKRADRHLQIPTYSEGFTHIEVMLQNAEVDEEARDFFRGKEKELIEDPVAVIRELQQDGRLFRFIPEYQGTIGLDQHNPHHSYEVFEHILKAASFVAGSSLKMVWTVLLHDIGKGYPGIKQFLGRFCESYPPFSAGEQVLIENGEAIRKGMDSGDTYLVRGIHVPKQFIETDLVGHFYDHENIGARLALRILIRLGYGNTFAYEVASLIRYHMTMPRNTAEVSAEQLSRWYKRVGRYAPELMMVRLADNRGK
jgi:predicted kinase